MKKFLKPGRVVVLLAGKHAGKKAVVLKANYEGARDKRFRHCLVAGLARYPRPVTRRMAADRVQRRLRLQPFVRYVNFAHIMPTRYHLADQLDVRALVRDFDAHAALKKDVEKARDPLANADFRADFRKQVKTALEAKYSALDINSSAPEASELRFLFKPLRF